MDYQSSKWKSGDEILDIKPEIMSLRRVSSTGGGVSSIGGYQHRGFSSTGVFQLRASILLCVYLFTMQTQGNVYIYKEMIEIYVYEEKIEIYVYEDGSEIYVYQDDSENLRIDIFFETLLFKAKESIIQI